MSALKSIYLEVIDLGSNNHHFKVKCKKKEGFLTLFVQFFYQSNYFSYYKTYHISQLTLEIKQPIVYNIILLDVIIIRDVFIYTFFIIHI